MKSLNLKYMWMSSLPMAIMETNNLLSCLSQKGFLYPLCHCVCRGPGGLKVEATSHTVYVEHFAGIEEVWGGF